jgi:hypothetical protein
VAVAVPGVRVVVIRRSGIHRVFVTVPVVLHTAYRVTRSPLQPPPSYCS